MKERRLQAEAEASEMLLPVGKLLQGSGEVMHCDPRETQPDPERALLQDTLEHPQMISVVASENRMNAALSAGALEAALDAAQTIGAKNSIEKMLAHQMAAAHSLAMKTMTVAHNHVNHTDDFWPEGYAQVVSSVARLMQAFQHGLLTWQKIRTGGKQTVVVQRVQVSQGSQAVIAASLKTEGRTNEQPVKAEKSKSKAQSKGKSKSKAKA